MPGQEKDNVIFVAFPPQKLFYAPQKAEIPPEPAPPPPPKKDFRDYGFPTVESLREAHPVGEGIPLDYVWPIITHSSTLAEICVMVYVYLETLAKGRASHYFGYQMFIAGMRNGLFDEEPPYMAGMLTHVNKIIPTISDLMALGKLWGVEDPEYPTKAIRLGINLEYPWEKEQLSLRSRGKFNGRNRPRY
jgi:hypothetical protein